MATTWTPPATWNPHPSGLVLPRVLLLLPVQNALFSPDPVPPNSDPNAIHEITTGAWEVREPWGPYRFLPDGRDFPFREVDVWVYTQLAGGLGPTTLGIEFRRRIQVDETRIEYSSIGNSALTTIDFEKENSRLSVYDTAFHFKKLPFREEGTYEFRVFAETPDGYQTLNGSTAEVTMLHPRGRV